MFTVTKDPNSTRNYKINWSRWLESGETISGVSWIVETGITNAGESNDTTTATLTLSGGTVGETYDCVCRITTNAAQIEDRTLQVTVAEK